MIQLQRIGGMLRHVGSPADAPIVRILADEFDSDGLGMVRELRRRGADAEIWSLDHLRVDPATGALAYRGADVAAPHLAIPYHVHLDDTTFGRLVDVERSGIALSNSSESIAISRDKGTTATRLLAAGVPHPATLEARSAADAMRAIDELHQGGVPIFFKNPVGTQGIGVAGISAPGDAHAVARFVYAASEDAARGQELLLSSGAPGSVPVLVRSAEEVEAAIGHVYRDGHPVRIEAAHAVGQGGAVELRSRGEAMAVAQLVLSGGDHARDGRRLLVQAGLKLAPGTPLHDTRHFLISARHAAAMDRVQEAAGELRTGLHSGAVGRPHHATAGERDITERTARALGLRGASGVDMFAGHVLEVNYGPGHRIALVTGVDIPGLMAEDAISRAAALQSSSAASARRATASASS